MFCLNCGYGGEEKTLNDELICPRCHATGAYLLDIPALAQGPMYQIDPDDPEYGSIFEVDMERDQDSGFTHPNLHRRTNEDSSEDESDTSYQILVKGTESYRITSTSMHDEESTTCEIP